MSRPKTRLERRLDEEMLNENLPIDVMPASNGEYLPEEPTREQIAITKLANEEAERVRRQFGVSRRNFVRTTAAFTVGLWAIGRVNPGKYGYYAFGANATPSVSDNPTWDACTLDRPGVQLQNLPGEFVLDVQSHHVVNDKKWRVAQPVHHAFICGLFGALEAASHNPPRTEADICQNVGKWHYLQNMFFDSVTTACILSSIPSAPDEVSPLPFADGVQTAIDARRLSGTKRVVVQGYVMPNRGRVRQQDNLGKVQFPASGDWPEPVRGPLSQGTGIPGPESPAGWPFLQDELDFMEERAAKYPEWTRSWKVYLAYGDVPYASGAAHDDEGGMAMNQQILDINKKWGVPTTLASHKGIWLPMFDDRRNATDDVPGAAVAFPEINFVIYHSGGGFKGVYPTDVGNSDEDIALDDYSEGLNGLIKNLKTKDLDASAHIPPGLAHGQTPNVYVDLGSVFPNGGPDQQALFMGTLIKHIGSQRICWGTDCTWYGSPQAYIVALRALRFTDEAKELFDLPHGLNGDRFDPRVRAWADEDESGPFDYSHYSQAYLDAHPALKDPEIGGNWPTDGQPHPERTIRNGIFGRNAAPIYDVDADASYAEMSCDDMNRLREEYLADRINGLASAGPSRSNQILGPRTKQEAIAMLNHEWKKNGFSA